jgi:hypothetical protein
MLSPPAAGLSDGAFHIGVREVETKRQPEVAAEQAVAEVAAKQAEVVAREKAEAEGVAAKSKAAATELRVAPTAMAMISGRDAHAAAARSVPEAAGDAACTSWLRERKKDARRPAPAGAASTSVSAVAAETLVSGGSWLRSSRAPKQSAVPKAGSVGHERYAAAQCASSAETRTPMPSDMGSGSIESFL